MKRHSLSSLLCGTAAGLLLLLMVLYLSSVPLARAAVIGTPTSAGLLVCVNQNTRIKPDGDVGGQVSVTMCNTPSAGGTAKTVGGSKVLGLAYLDDGGNTATIYVRDPNVPTTTTYTLTVRMNLGAANLVVGGAVDYRAGDFNGWRPILGF